MNGGTIDIHTHFLPSTLVAALERRDELPRISATPDGQLIEYGEGQVHPMLPAMSDLAMRLRDMDAQGIEIAVLGVNVPGADWFPERDGPAVARAVNDELADLVASHRSRLAAMAILPMQVPEDAAAELERAAGLGFRGAMIYSNVAGQPLDERQFEVVFDTAARLGVPIFIHPTFPLSAASVRAYALMPTLGFLFDTTTAVMRLILGGVYERNPELKLVLAHAGSLIPQLVGRIDYEAARDPNGLGASSVPPSERLRQLYTDAVCVWAPALVSTLAFFGPQRVMFGSDYPFWEPERTYSTIEEAGFDDDVRQSITAGNARRVFSLPG
jgi:predicted TIM-barrel fold metal-dependent hydrolase